MSRLREKIKSIPNGVWLVITIFLILGLSRIWQIHTPKRQAHTIGVVAPDGMSASDPKLAVWLDALREQGLQAETVNLSELISLSIWGDESTIDYRALILPDGILQKSDKRLKSALEIYVTRGGNLLVCYDAMSQNGSGPWTENRTDLSSLVGVDYSAFTSSNAGAIAFGPILGTDEAMNELQIPPGKPVPWPPSKTQQLALSTYQYGFVTYPHYVTRGVFHGKKLLESNDGSLLLGDRKYGAGNVTFANLPLGDLKGRTDGILLHAVIRRLGDQVGLPNLMASPSAIGGLIFNMHVDANTSLTPFAEFDRRGFFSQGPFSFHFTTGPDAYKKGDHAGMDLEKNKTMQQWIKRFVERGDGIGNHGGWIHDYFGHKLGDSANAEMKSLLEKNDLLLEKFIKRPILEYSAPMGNQPEWVTNLLEDRGVLAYYFTGNSGMSPTRSYRDGKLNASKIWSFPILNLNQIASFEEGQQEDIPDAYIARWLISVAQFASDSSSIRTLYSHPPGWLNYFDSLQLWFDYTGQLIKEGSFRWYTMENVAKFLNRREQVQWDVDQIGLTHRFSASHPDTLKEMTWRLPKSAYSIPKVESGSAQLRETTDAWLVISQDNKKLVFSSKTLPPQTP